MTQQGAFAVASLVLQPEAELSVSEGVAGLTSGARTSSPSHESSREPRDLSSSHSNLDPRSSSLSQERIELLSLDLHLFARSPLHSFNTYNKIPTSWQLPPLIMLPVKHTRSSAHQLLPTDYQQYLSSPRNHYWPVPHKRQQPVLLPSIPQRAPLCHYSHRLLQVSHPLPYLQ